MLSFTLIINGFIVLLSALLLAYWFRYTCLLIVRSDHSQSYAKQVAAANQLNFIRVKSELQRSSVPPELDRLYALLERDYRLLLYLLNNGARFRKSGWDVEQWLLRVDFQFMQAAYSVSRRMRVAQGQPALREMAEIITHLANTIGERAAHAAAR